MTMLHMAMTHGGHEGMGGMDGLMSAWMVAWLLLALVLAGLAVAAIVWLARNMRSPGHADEARRELDMRYARGELTSEEYDERRQRMHAE